MSEEIHLHANTDADGTAVLFLANAPLRFYARVSKVYYDFEMDAQALAGQTVALSNFFRWGGPSLSDAPLSCWGTVSSATGGSHEVAIDCR